MATLNVDPNPTLPNSTVTLDAVGFTPSVPTRLLLDGSAGSYNSFAAPADGTFYVGRTVGSNEKTQILSVQQWVRGAWRAAIASVSIVVKKATLPPAPTLSAEARDGSIFLTWV